MAVDTSDLAARPTTAAAVNDPAFSGGATPEGILHLLGNVMEWTATESDCSSVCETVSVNFTDLSNCQNTCTAPRWNGTLPTTLLIRGWSWNAGQITLPPGPEAYWHTPLVEILIAEATTVREDLGFRCALSR
jgi:formylglycine-generating enzyme required for sulfatase activity